MRVVTIEEHVNRPNVKDYMGWQPQAVLARLAPSVEQRIADMDVAGIAVQVLSAPLPASVREKMAHGTAEQLLRLPVSANGQDPAIHVSRA